MNEAKYVLSDTLAHKHTGRQPRPLGAAKSQTSKIVFPLFFWFRCVIYHQTAMGWLVEGKEGIARMGKINRHNNFLTAHPRITQATHQSPLHAVVVHFFQPSERGGIR